MKESKGADEEELLTRLQAASVSLVLYDQVQYRLNDLGVRDLEKMRCIHVMT